MCWIFLLETEVYINIFYHSPTQKCHLLKFTYKEDKDISFCTVNIMAADDLETWGDRSLAAMFWN